MPKWFKISKHEAKFRNPGFTPKTEASLVDSKNLTNHHIVEMGEISRFGGQLRYSG